MKKVFLILLAFSSILISCFSKRDREVVDDIVFDKSLDNPNFKICSNQIFQYFNDSRGLLYGGEKLAILKAFKLKYNPQVVAKESGLVRIRFIVNCEGKTDRFRLLSMDNNYNEKIFDTNITSQLLKITKELDGWEVKEIKDKPVDYYQYLIFVIQNGEITKILP